MPDRLCSIDLKANGTAVLSIPGKSTASPRELLETLHRKIATLAGNDDVKGLILTGSEHIFCDCMMAKCATVQEASALSGFGQLVMADLEKTGRPCISVITGECSAIGLEVALACDFIVAADTASFGFTHIASGLLPFCGGSQRLARLVGKSKTKEIIYSGELIAADEAYRIGLVNRIYPSNEVMSRAADMLAHICTRSPNAIRVGGEVVSAGYDIDLQTACMLERDAFALCFASLDQREGMQAFLDKRQPQFKGV